MNDIWIAISILLMGLLVVLPLWFPRSAPPVEHDRDAGKNGSYYDRIRAIANAQKGRKAQPDSYGARVTRIGKPRRPGGSPYHEDSHAN